jgi:ATP-binding cassette subfamily B protein
MSAMMPTMMLVMNLVTVLVVWIGSKQVSESSLDVGGMMAYMQYVMQILTAFLMMSMMFIMIPRASVSANRIADVLEAEASIADTPNPAGVAAPRGETGAIEFRDVSFAYPGANDYALRHVSFTARPGQTTAFIGPTGSGKSTIVNLIPRFYDVTEGQILIDGSDVRDMPLAELRSRLGFVPQKSVLFSGSVRSNISFADEGAPESELWRAARISQAAEFIEARPEGLDYEIAQGGANVSGGQRQRLSIARALARDARFYIFDDSFSALDFKTDAALRAALAKELGGRAILVVTQRVSSAMKAGQIVVLDHGRVAGVGKHGELMKNCGIYRDIAHSQIGREGLPT